MSFVSLKELPRQNVYEVGQKRTLQREFVVVLSDSAIVSTMSESAVLSSSGLDLFNRHPVYTAYQLRKLTYKEGHDESPYHAHVRAEYDIILPRETATPTARSSLWSFSAQPGEVPAFFYYFGSGNGTKYPLTNSAYDYFPGLVTQEAVVTVEIEQNFPTVPNNWLQAQNHVNSDVYLGCPIHSLKVEKVEVVQELEEFGGVPTPYWKATAEIRFRQSGHNYQLPDIGFNFLDGTEKRRCMVFDFKNDEWVPSPNPVGLDGNGAQTAGAPAVLDRRVNPETNFLALFGQPPTTPVY